MGTTALDIIGILALAAAAFIFAGIGATLTVVGVGCLVISWSMSR